MRATGPGPGQSPALVITSPYLLSRGQLDQLARLPGDVLVVEPDSATLAAVNEQAPPPGLPGPRVPGPGAAGHGGGSGGSPRGPPRLRTSCRDRGGGRGAGRGAHAGPQRSGASTSGGGADAGQCYQVDGHPSLVRYLAGGRTVTLLGTGVPLTNAALARRGNAALALNLLRGSPRIVWLVPSPAAVPVAGQKSLFQEIPGPAYLVTIQLFLAAGLAALWRSRRLGPLVAEPLPVVVRASETVEGHGRLIPVPPVPRPGGRGAARRGPATGSPPGWRCRTGPALMRCAQRRAR